MLAAIANGLHAMGEAEKAAQFLRSRAQPVKQLSHVTSWVGEVLRTVGMRRIEVPDGIV